MDHDHSNHHEVVSTSKVQVEERRHGEIKWPWDLVAMVTVMFVKTVESPGFLTTLDDTREMETSEHRFKNTHRVYRQSQSQFLPTLFPLGIHILDLHVYVLIPCIK